VSERILKPDPECPACFGTGVCDSGGFTPWDTPIEVRCACTYPTETTTAFGNLFTPKRDGI
jgi:hypothetical protein